MGLTGPIRHPPDPSHLLGVPFPKKSPSPLQAIFKFVFGSKSSVFLGYKNRCIAAQLKKDGLYSVALECLGMQGTSSQQVRQKIQDVHSAINSFFGEQNTSVDRYVQGVLTGNKDTLDEIWQVLESNAKILGYTDAASGFRSLSSIMDLWKGPLDDKLLVLQLIKDQMQARDIQVGAMQELFSMVPVGDLEEAVAKHYEVSDEPLSVRIPIGSNGLAKVYFTNEKGQVEVALIYLKDGAAGSYKKYHFAGTMSSIKDIACLDMYCKSTQVGESPNALEREIGFWRTQMNAGVKHIPDLYSHTEKSIFCENYAGGNVADYIKDPTCTPEIREQLFRDAGLTILEYLEDIERLGLVNRDLKPDNLLLSKDHKKIAVTDFGCMATVGERLPVTVTPGYAAPELCKDDGIIPASDTRSDLYSAAMMLTTIRYLKGPFFAGGDVAKKKEACNGTSELDAFDKLLMSMQAEKPEDRPSLADALKEWRGLCSSNKVKPEGNSPE